MRNWRKKMRKHGFLFALTAALTVSMCGCGSVDGVTSPANSGVMSEQTSGLVSGLADSSPDLFGNSNSASGIGTDIGENTQFPGKCKIYKSSAVKFTDEQLFDFFNAHPECGSPQKTEYYTDDYHRYEAVGCSGHISDGNGFMFYTEKGKLYDDVHYYLAKLDSTHTNRKYISADGDLDFATRDEVLEKVRAELSERFGIMPDEWWALEFDAVKKEGVEEYKQKAYRDAYEPDKIYEDDLEKEKQHYERIKDLPTDDFYYFNIKYKAEDIPIFPGGLLSGGDFMSSGPTITGTISYLVYGRNGIEYIMISPAYKTDASTGYTEAELIPADQARGLIQKKYDDLVTDNQIEVLDMKLFYLPIPQNDLGEHGKNFELRPHYGFYTTETETYDGETHTVNKVTYFDAVAGDELTSVQDWEGIGREWGFDV